MQKLHFALIGCGKIAERHAEHISNVGVLSAVCDIDKQKAIDFSKRYNARSYDHIEDLLKNEKNIDAASICTPNGLHASHSIACLESGLNVLCEKPMAIDLDECRMMIAAAEASGKMFAVVKQNRFNPPIVALKQMIDENKLGRILSIQVNGFWNRDEAYYDQSEWRGTEELDGGTLFTQFSHFIDIMYWLIGDVVAARSYLVNANHERVIDFEDTGAVILQFENGVIGTLNYTVNSYGKNMEGSITVFGDKGTVKIGGEYLNKLEYQNIQSYIIADLPDGNLPNNYGSYTGSMSNHGLVYDNFVEAIQNKTSISANAYDGMKTVDIIRKIYDANCYSYISEKITSAKKG